MAIYGVQKCGWSVEHPIAVTVERDEDGSYIVSDDRFLVYGVGDTQSEAIDDYLVSLVEYFDLIRGEVATNPAAETEYQYLRKVLVRLTDSPLSHAL